MDDLKSVNRYSKKSDLFIFIDSRLDPIDISAAFGHFGRR